MTGGGMGVIAPNLSAFGLDPEAYAAARVNDPPQIYCGLFFANACLKIE